MIGARRVRRVVAVVRAEDQEVAGTQLLLEDPQVLVERLERPPIAGRVAAVAEEHVEVDEVEEQKATLEPPGQLRRLAHPVAVPLGVVILGHAPPGEDVVDLADPDHRLARSLQEIEHGVFRRLQRVVAAVVRPLVVPGLADEGSRDHSRHTEGIQDASRFDGDLVESLEAEVLLVRRDLEDAVRAGVDDRLARPDVLLAELGDHRGSRRGPVAEDPLELAAPDERVDDLRREAVGEGGERALQRAPHHLPVTGRGVLAGGLLGTAPEHCFRIARFRELLHADDVAQPQLDQPGCLQTSSRGDDVIEGVRPRITEALGIG